MLKVLLDPHTVRTHIRMMLIWLCRNADVFSSHCRAANRNAYAAGTSAAGDPDCF